MVTEFYITRYQASDGTQFDTRIDATRHDAAIAILHLAAEDSILAPDQHDIAYWFVEKFLSADPTKLEEWIIFFGSSNR